MKYGPGGNFEEPDETRVDKMLANAPSKVADFGKTEFKPVPWTSMRTAVALSDLKYPGKSGLKSKFADVS